MSQNVVQGIRVFARYFIWSVGVLKALLLDHIHCPADLHQKCGDPPVTQDGILGDDIRNGPRQNVIERDSFEYLHGSMQLVACVFVGSND